MDSNFLSRYQIDEIGFCSVGENVLLSRDARFYDPKNITIESNVRIDDFCILSGNIHIGNYVHIGSSSILIAGDAGIIMEDFSGISHRVCIFAQSDDFGGSSLISPMAPPEYRKVKKGKVILCRHSLIGSSSVILPGCILSEGTAVGAMSMVVRRTEPWTTYSGIPARKIASRSREALQLGAQLVSDKIVTIAGR
ncbi:MAG: acyltransferase [Planctomycetes bacterium]|nr:acyltransferase [Planctomycetota bacterium]